MLRLLRQVENLIHTEERGEVLKVLKTFKCFILTRAQKIVEVRHCRDCFRKEKQSRRDNNKVEKNDGAPGDRTLLGGAFNVRTPSRESYPNRGSSRFDSNSKCGKLKQNVTPKRVDFIDRFI